MYHSIQPTEKFSVLTDKCIVHYRMLILVLFSFLKGCGNIKLDVGNTTSNSFVNLTLISNLIQSE